MQREIKGHSGESGILADCLRATRESLVFCFFFTVSYFFLRSSVDQPQLRLLGAHLDCWRPETVASKQLECVSLWLVLSSVAFELRPN